MKTIGVFHGSWLFGRLDMRQLALLFDQLAIMELGPLLSSRASEMCPPQLRDELEWLGDRDLVVEAPSFSGLTQEIIEKYQADLNKIPRPPEFGEAEQKTLVNGDRAKTEELLKLHTSRLYALALQQARLLSVIMRNEFVCDSCSVWDDVSRALRVVSNDPNATVVNVTLSRFPMPEPDTPWEQILEFKADSETNQKLRRLRLWIAKLGRENRSPVEIADLLETSVHEYEQHLRVAKIRFRHGTLQSLLLVTADVLENLAHLKFGKATEQLLSIGEKRIQLLDHELKAPGRELAYLASVRQRFGKNQ